MTDHQLRALGGPCETCGRDPSGGAAFILYHIKDVELRTDSPYVVDVGFMGEAHPFLGRPTETMWQSIVRRYAVERGFEVQR